MAEAVRACAHWHLTSRNLSRFCSVVERMIAVAKEDIEKDGGSCDFVATDFWECTDKDGKRLWCNHEGCTPKPHMVGSLGIASMRVDLLVMHNKETGGVIVTAPVVTRGTFDEPA